MADAKLGHIRPGRWRASGSLRCPGAPAVKQKADQPRLVSLYKGMAIFDARKTIRVRLIGEPPRGLKGSLRMSGFRTYEPGIWEAPHTPANIFTAENIGAEFFGKP